MSASMMPIIAMILNCKYQILLGVVLGVITSFLGYGAGGGLILSLVVGSLYLVCNSGRLRTIKTFVYCVSLCLAFYVAGFTKISEPLSLIALLIFLVMILVPVCVAFVVNMMSETSMADQGSALGSISCAESEPR